jgi:alkylhydroperoxidase/carboxymuconolactone decarboxylase family protein YurZ
MSFFGEFMDSVFRPATTKVAEVNAQAVDRYKEMRKAFMGHAELDQRTCEIVHACQLAALGLEASFKMHAIRLFDIGISKDALQALILSGVGVTLVVGQAATTLDWIDVAHAHFQASH